MKFNYYIPYRYSTVYIWRIFMSNKCTCGRSPNGNCVGWHNLSEEDYKKRQEVYNDKKKNKS